tara:strand:- start:305 stop:577 length:273 start_codon:yes stop_codon:yes gene_type:complete
MGRKIFNIVVGDRYHELEMLEWLDKEYRSMSYWKYDIAIKMSHIYSDLNREEQFRDEKFLRSVFDYLYKSKNVFLVKQIGRDKFYRICPL